MLSEQPFEADLHLGLKLAEDGETKQAQADFFERYYRTNGRFRLSEQQSI